MAIVHHRTRMQVRSMPGSRSRVLTDLTANGQVLTGTWTEETNPAGYYQGAVCHGAIQLLLEPTGREMTGKRVGFGRDFDLNTGLWTLELLTAERQPRSSFAGSYGFHDRGSPVIAGYRWRPTITAGTVSHRAICPVCGS